MKPKERLKRAVHRLRQAVDPYPPSREELMEIRASIAQAEREIHGPKKRAKRGEGAQGRILAYLKKNVGVAVAGEAIREISDIQEWARRVRELRVEKGYDIVEEDGMYTLVSPKPDEKAAERWQTANRIRRIPGDGRSRILEYLKAHVGEVVSLTELHYVALIKEVPRRVRELRDELGYRISSRHHRPDLRPDQYVLETQEPIDANERRVKPAVRDEVFERDGTRCTRCGAVPGVGVWLEIDHIKEKADGGSDDPTNLRTLCNSCHAAKTAKYQSHRRGPRAR